MDEVRVMRETLRILKCNEAEVIQKVLALKRRLESLEKALSDLDRFISMLEC